MTLVTVRACTVGVLALALVLWVGPAGGQQAASAQDDSAVTRGDCFVDPSGDVVGAGGEPTEGPDAERADIVDYCVDFGAERRSSPCASPTRPTPARTRIGPGSIT